jgi:hypothetical protein
MRILIVLCFIVGSFSSCVTYNKCLVKYGKEMRDTLIETKEVILYDTTIKYHTDTFRILPESVLIYDTLPFVLPDSFHYHREKRSISGFLSASATIQGNKLNFNCSTDSLEKVIRYQDSVLRVNKIKTQTIYITKTITFKPKGNWLRQQPLYVKASLLLILLILLALIVKKIFRL